MQQMIKGFLREEDGGPAIEFGLIGMFIAAALPAMIDMADLIDSHMRLSNGMRAGAQYATKYPTDSAGIAQAIASASGFDSQDVTAATSLKCECASITTSCSSSCSAGVQMSKYAEIEAAANLNDDLNYGDMFPQYVTKTMTVRYQ